MKREDQAAVHGASFYRGRIPLRRLLSAPVALLVVVLLAFFVALAMVRQKRETDEARERLAPWP